MIEGITPAQREALRILAPLLASDAYLAGGVAVALRLGHRLSRDIDLFVPSGAPEELVASLAQAEISVRILSRAPGTLHLELVGVPTSVLRYAYPMLRPLERIPEIAVPVAAPEDLISMKLSAIAGRGARRDFWDLHALLERSAMPLAQALRFFEEKFPVEDVGHVIRSLVYFADAESEPFPSSLTDDHWKQIQSDLTQWVRAL